MKPLFCIDVTENKKNEVVNGQEFVVATASSVLSLSLNEGNEEAMKIEEKAKLPLALRITQTFCRLAAAILVIGILRGTSEIGLAQGYANAPYLFWIGGVCLVVWLILMLISKKKEKEVMSSEDTQQVLHELEETAGNLYRELGVPEDAPSMDVLMCRYKIKKGQVVISPVGLSPDFFNLNVKVYVQDGQLFICDLETASAIPLSDLRGIRLVNKRVSIPSWNKDVAYDEGIYKPFKITTNNYGWLFFKPYYILEFERNGETLGIYIPCYELSLIQSLTGLTVNDSTAH